MSKQGLHKQISLHKLGIPIHKPAADMSVDIPTGLPYLIHQNRVFIMAMTECHTRPRHRELIDNSSPTPEK